jgi:hypothetical protein
MLKITNGNAFDLTDRFDGTDYSFPAGGTAFITDDAARHIFGFGAPDKAPYLTRLGWMRTSGDYEEGMKRLNGFSFASADTPDQNELQQDEQGLAPLQPGAVEETVTDGAAESAAPTPIREAPASENPTPPGPRRSILSQLAGG